MWVGYAFPITANGECVCVCVYLRANRQRKADHKRKQIEMNWFLCFIFGLHTLLIHLFIAIESKEILFLFFLSDFVQATNTTKRGEKRKIDCRKSHILDCRTNYRSAKTVTMSLFLFFSFPNKKSIDFVFTDTRTHTCSTVKSYSISTSKIKSNGRSKKKKKNNEKCFLKIMTFSFALHFLEYADAFLSSYSFPWLRIFPAAFFLSLKGVSRHSFKYLPRIFDVWPNLFPWTNFYASESHYSLFVIFDNKTRKNHFHFSNIILSSSRYFLSRNT